MAYGWKNNYDHQNTENPEYYAIIGLLLELFDVYKVEVNKDGELSKK